MNQVPRRPCHRSLGVVGCLLVLLVTVMGVEIDASPAGAGTFQAHTYNMAMGNPTLSTQYGALLHNQTQADAILIPEQQHPWSLSTQEMCFDQYGTVLFSLDDYGYGGGILFPPG